MTDMRRQHGRPAVLVIAATDSSGGAGLTRDVRVLTDFSADALCVVTAVTAQSDKRVTAIHHVPPEVIRAQIVGALETRRVGAIKLGMLGTRATVEAVAESLTEALSATRGRASGGRAPATAGGPVSEVAPASRASIPVVVDPVLVSSSGGVLLDAAGRAALLEKVLPLATLVTPNVPEVAALLGEPVAADEAELIEQGQRLLELGCRAILLKGGHAAGEEAVDLLIARGAFGAGNRDHHGGRHANVGQGGWNDALQNDAGRDDVAQGDAGQSDAGRIAGLDSEQVANGRRTDDRRIWQLDDGADYTVVVERITSRRVAGSSRGTGCALASGIAAGLASGLSLLDACRQAKHYVLEKMLTPRPNNS